MNPSFNPLKPIGRRPALAALLALAVGGGAQATQLVPQNLTQLIQQADVVVTGTVTQLSDGIAPNGAPYTQVTLKVKSSLRKPMATGSEFRFRQFGMQKARKMPNGKILLPMHIEGMPTWREGEQVTVFLNPAANAQGLRTPVGLQQGKFSHIEGRLMNGQRNLGLFDKVKIKAAMSRKEAALLQQPAGAVDEAAFMSLVQRAITESWIEKGIMK